MDSLSLSDVIGSALGAGAVQLVASLYVRADLHAFHAWAVELADKFKFRPPPPLRTRGA